MALIGAQLKWEFDNMALKLQQPAEQANTIAHFVHLNRAYYNIQLSLQKVK